MKLYTIIIIMILLSTGIVQGYGTVVGDLNATTIYQSTYQVYDTNDLQGDVTTAGPLTGAVNNILLGVGTKLALAITQATTSTDGYLSSTDWNTFNDKTDDVTATSPLVSSGGATPDISATIAKDLVTTAPLTGAVDNVFLGTDSDITIAVTVLKDLVAGDGLQGGADDVLTGSDADVTFNFDCSDVAGNGISCSGEDLVVGGNTALTQDVDGLSVTADGIGDTQLTYNTGQHLTTTSTPTFGESLSLTNAGSQTVSITTTNDDDVWTFGVDGTDLDNFVISNAADFSSPEMRLTYAGNVIFTGALTTTSINTGPGFTEVYAMNQDVESTDAVTFITLNTGQGANELYDMDQNVLTTSTPTFDGICFNSDCSFNVTGNCTYYPSGGADCSGS